MIAGDKLDVSMVITMTALIDITQVSVQIRASQTINIISYSLHGCQRTIIIISKRNALYAAVLQKHKYESGATIDKRSWGYRRNTNFTADFLTIENLIWQLVSTVR